MAKPQKGSSIVWDFFAIDQDNESFAICSLCHGKLSRGDIGQKKKNYSTSNLMSHLKKKHHEQLKKVEKTKNVNLKRKNNEFEPRPGCSNIAKAQCRDVTQLTLEGTMQLKKVWDINNSHAQEIHYAIAEMIAIDVQPISVVEDEGFKKVCHKLNPKYDPPSRTYFRGKIIEDIYNRVKFRITDMIKESPYISLTSDGWTAAYSNAGFLSITGHWIDKHYKQNTAILKVTPASDKHTTENIKNWILEGIKVYEIPTSKVHFIVRDNAANMVAGIRETNIESIGCFIHTMQLVLNDAIFNQQYVKNIITICKNIVSYFNRSPQNYIMLNEIQDRYNIPKNKLIQDVETRWNSQYYMLKRILEQKLALITWEDESRNTGRKNANKVDLNNDQWECVKKLVKILEPFDSVTKKLSHRNCTVSEIIPSIYVFKLYLYKAEKDTKFSGLGSCISGWQESCKLRFDKYWENKNLIIATFLDPRYNKNFLGKSDDFESADNNNYGTNDDKDLVEFNLKKIRSCLLDEIVQYYEQQNREIDSDSDSVRSSNSNSNQSDTGEDSHNTGTNCNSGDASADFDSIIKGILKKTSDKKRTSEDEEGSSADGVKKEKIKRALNEEINRYILYDLLDEKKEKKSSLEWWNEKKTSFKYLPILVKKYLSSPPSSVESERVFSTGGTIYSAKRNRLKPETGEILMFLHFNLPLLNYKY